MAALGCVLGIPSHNSLGSAFYWQVITYFFVATLGSFITLLFYSLKSKSKLSQRQSTILNVCVCSEMAVTILTSTGFFCLASELIVACYIILAVITHGMLLYKYAYAEKIDAS